MAAASSESPHQEDNTIQRRRGVAQRCLLVLSIASITASRRFLILLVVGHDASPTLRVRKCATASMCNTFHGPLTILHYCIYSIAALFDNDLRFDVVTRLPLNSSKKERSNAAGVVSDDRDAGVIL